MNAKVFSITGEEIRDIELDEEVFNREVSRGAIYYAIRNELANRRVGTACTKTRAEVNKSNTKPWAQKGTGRARAGDKKSPVWVGGGIIFGPRPRDYNYTIPRKMKQAAMRSILSLKYKENQIKIVENFTLEGAKTKELASILGHLIKPERAVIILRDEDGLIRRAGRNIPWLKFLSYNRLAAHELFYGRQILVLEDAARSLNEHYALKAGKKAGERRGD
ncbi:MAG: 50S ribosomal protein L4 [Spirochaetales bacterium]|jgi:large subunit ribosomal protein L4|nr:50S ribosomal protein L4 [Spirochaetales bacterium]